MQPGIYIICAEPAIIFGGLPSPIHDAIYVGQAISLRTRFLTHCRNPARRLKMARLCFEDRLKFYFVEADPREVARLESRLIKCFGPPANEIQGVIEAVIGSPRSA
jgi:excinuclease UvrABC nuclease subunit